MPRTGLPTKVLLGRTSHALKLECCDARPGSSEFKLFVGVDVHRKKHVIAFLTQPKSGASPRMQDARLLEIRNTREDFNRLQTAIEEYRFKPGEVAVAVDHTGGHLSEPLAFFLCGAGYHAVYLETRAVKSARERLLDQTDKSDRTDATASAYLLYLRSFHGISFRIASRTIEFSSRAHFLKSLLAQNAQHTKALGQAKNRLHHLLVAVFPEAEARYFGLLARLAPVLPTPSEIVRFPERLEKFKWASKSAREDLLRLARETVGVPGGIYRATIRSLAGC